MFRMYDTDKNGFLDQEEMDSIVDQMMTVAEYMGWETNELRPVSDKQWHGDAVQRIKSPFNIMQWPMNNEPQQVLDICSLWLQAKNNLMTFCLHE